MASAVASGADVLVTGDAALLKLGKRAPLPIVSPRGLWERPALPPLHRGGPRDGVYGRDPALRAGREGDIEVAGPDLAQSLAVLGLIDAYRIYLHPVVLGRGKPFFAGPRPRLHLMAHDRIGEDVIRLVYVPA